ncbi:efflux RND transporter permease subunit [Planctomyces sp. SH-PL14]|uniref:efflux RND transporter permease subunit n=1 Tax=Planctomyces sp. SH-PL14 TaxID=1632864 RepID=UPI00078DEB81|nr:efflux RND transporter permease subunit [Planctomyces sp. SH-PL14]AMV16793.1 Cobalt-zinc-cadmium resistance protein CzcA [Planctomyces sp. SH-PL14]
MTVSQYFVYKRPIAWTLLMATLIAGFAAYRAMPQRQDPVIQIRSGLVMTVYPGADPLEVEQEVSRRIERKLAENPAVEHVRSTNREGLSAVFVDLYDTTKNADAIWQDLDNKLASMTDLPSVGGTMVKPILDKDFGDTVAIMLTLASPPVTDQEVAQRAGVIRRRIEESRAAREPQFQNHRWSAVIVHPSTVDSALLERLGQQGLRTLADQGLAEDGVTIPLLGAAVIDFHVPSGADSARIETALAEWREAPRTLSHPDVWPGVVVENPTDLEAALRQRCQEEPGGVARYSYEELRQLADVVQDRLRQSTKIGKIEQMGVVDQRIDLYFSNPRLAPYGLDFGQLADALQKRNMTLPGGTIELPHQNLAVKPSGKLRSEREIGEIVVDVRDGTPLYLRDLVDISRGYDDSPRLLNFRTRKFPAMDRPTGPVAAGSSVVPVTGSSAESSVEASAASGAPQLWTSRAITLAIRQVKGTQIEEFSRDVDAGLASLRGVLPDDLWIERTSDEPERVGFKIHEFVQCLVEAIVIVVLVSLLFMEWRSALIIALSIPITLAMTFLFCALLGVDLQQISIAALIIALGLLVDDPVVAGDAINRELAHGTPRDVAAWLGPQKLSRAILYATVTNCAAFLPLLVVSGGVGEFIWSLPVVVTASLVASRLVSMTFIPLLGYYLLKGQLGLEAGMAEGGKGSRFARIYNGFSEACMNHKWASLTICLIVLIAGLSLLPLIGTNLFPKDLHSAFTVNLFLPEGTSIHETKREALAAIRRIDGLIGKDVEGYTTFVGQGGPRFWLSIVPEQPATNYAQLMVHTRDKRHTYAVAERLKAELPKHLAAARVHVQALESGPPIGIPVQFRLLGSDVATLRRLGEQVKGFMREIPGTHNIQDDWDPEYLRVGLEVDPERANVSGVSHEDVAMLMNASLSGYTATSIREGDRLIPIAFRLRPDERGSLEALQALSVVGSKSGARVPLSQIGTLRPEFIPPKIARRDNERCLTVKCDVAPGLLASRAYELIEAKLAGAVPEWPPGYHFQIGGEKEEQGKGFGSLTIAMIVSVLAIYVALILQFNSLTKPLVVFAAVPFGMVGGLMGLIVFGVPLGFFALLGVSSLIGVIISHVIVLFEYIEEAHERGEPLRRAVIDAALVRLRPVLVTVLATVGGLIPLAIKGGPLWEPLCYVQIMGLLIATLVTKVVVPVFYVLFVEDFGLIKWSAPGEHVQEGPPAEYVHAGHGGHHGPVVPVAPSPALSPIPAIAT